MKTNSKAHRLLRIRGILFVLLLAVMGGLEFGVSESLAARFNQTTASRTAIPQVPVADLADWMAAMR